MLYVIDADIERRKPDSTIEAVIQYERIRKRTTPFFASYLNCCSGIVFCFAVRLWGGMIASVPRSSSPP